MKSIREVTFTLLLLFWFCAGAEPAPSVEVFPPDPDLHPQLTASEAKQVFRDWSPNSVLLAHDSPERRLERETAHHELAPLLDGATRIVLYSLDPCDSECIRDNYKRALAKKLLAKPAFHGYPIYGEIWINKEDAVNRWKSFLQGETVGWEVSMCDFAPRHGFRFVTPRGKVNILMCFHCSPIVIYGAPKAESKLPRFHVAVFSYHVKQALDALFRKRKIEQDPGYLAELREQ